MKNIIGYLKNLHGVFFAKDTNDNLRKIDSGDPVYTGEIIVDENGHIVHDALRSIKEDSVENVNNGADVNADLPHDIPSDNEKDNYLPSNKHSSTSTDSFDNTNLDSNVNSYFTLKYSAKNNLMI